VKAEGNFVSEKNDNSYVNTAACSGLRVSLNQIGKKMRLQVTSHNFRHSELKARLCDVNCLDLPIAVAERSKARTVFARSNTAIVGLNPTEAWMFVCVPCAFFLFLHSLK
jgi:hypothetical protein